ncbi:MAG: translation initiation factor IF-2 [Paludibacteraceae bacterium]|nr:translation initiation factor IF-2 [Paludibacteraceae bacterium]
MRINKALKELNVGLDTVVEFLHEKGYTDVKSDLNGKISDEQFDLLVEEFAKDKKIKMESEKLREQKKSKDVAPTVAIDGFGEQKEEKPATQEPEVIKVEIDTKKLPKLKPVGKIDLDKNNMPKKEEAKKVEPEINEEKNISKEIEIIDSSKEEVFSLKSKPTTEGPKVLGKIDLSSINDKTRPSKKSKEELKRERDKRNKVAQGQSQSSNQSNQGKGGEHNKKKRARINQERVDINNANVGAQNNQKNNAKGNNGQPNANNHKKNKKNKNNAPVAKEVSEEDVQRQIKETLARLTEKKVKGAKYRKDKREAASARQEQQEELARQENQIIKLTEFVTANELATMMNVSVNQVIGTCMTLGIMVSINQRLDAETINIVAEEFGFKTEFVSAEVAEAIAEEEDKEEDLLPRAPIVTVMGHVDHGKTSLLDYIRKANVIAGEAGGITQHIGAYHVTLDNGRKITFLDTPGHEAFTAMRARGAKVTDIAIIIVAADDNVMPQTKEAINHASAAGVPIVFAINKIDKESANPDKIKEELATLNYLVEEWGGKYQSQDISAKKGLNVNELLEKVLLEADLLELKANPNRKAVASVIESSLDKGRGYVSTVLVQTGTLRVGDVVLAGQYYGKVKAMFNERNQRITEVGPSEPALILGLNGAPTAGDNLNVMSSEQEAREIANKREQLQREQGLRTTTHLTLEEIARRKALGNFQELNVIVKGDVDGSIEALSDSLIKLSTEEIQVNVIHKAVGAISESDVMLAATSDAIIFGFQVRPTVEARRSAEHEGVDIRLYSIIYDAIEDLKDAMEGMLSPELKEEFQANVEVREVFKISKVGTIAGCMVKEGTVKRTSKIRVIRDGIVVYTGELGSLKVYKDDVKEVKHGHECGLNIAGYNDIQIGDIIEAYEMTEVKRKL